jgi:tRNA(Met) cytidine acetyltransferase
MNYLTIIQSIKNAIKANHRRLIVIASESWKDRLNEILKVYSNLKMNFSCLIISKDLREEIKELILKYEPVKLTCEIFKEVEKVMGTTYDVLIININERLSANDLGRLLEVVAGGGIAILISPPLSKLRKIVTSFHLRLIRTPYKIEDLKHNFEERLVNKLLNGKGIWIIDDELGIVGNDYEEKDYRKPEVNFETSKVVKEITSIVATNDQLKAIENFLELLELSLKGKERKAYLLTSNRGRGKSASLGLMLSLLVNKKGRNGIKIYVTAPNPANVQTLFEFASLGLKKLGYEPKIKMKEGNQPVLTCDNCEIEYITPFELMPRNFDYVFVDEAAGIPVEALFAIVEKTKFSVFASTVHGYEGSGRGFALRFCSKIRKEKGVKLIEFYMNEPIRYADKDPIEAWLYDTLLLNAEPPKLKFKSHEINKVILKYKALDLKKLFKDDKLLANFVGIYVTAHYRNEPDDLLILGDSPAHHARALVSEDNMILLSLHITEEGGMEEDDIEEIAKGEIPPGNLIPSVSAKYYFPFKQFAKLKGVRIIRIATHPQLFRRGLGSKALKFLEKECKDRDMDWVGASFGASYELLTFWLKNGFLPIHFSPSRNPASGEYSCVVVKPLSKRAKKLIFNLSREFRLRLIDSLQDPYYYLSCQLARLLFTSPHVNYKHELRLTKTQSYRLRRYAEGGLVYEACRDAILALLKTHFVSSGIRRLNLDEKEEELLIAKCLQGKPWRAASQASKVPYVEIKSKFRQIIARLVGFYITTT